MSNNRRPLAAALGITLTIAAGGAAVAMGRHQNHRHGAAAGVERQPDHPQP